MTSKSKKMSKKKFVKTFKNLIKTLKTNSGSAYTDFIKCKENFCSKENKNYLKDIKNLSKQMSKKKSSSKKPINKKKFMKSINKYFSNLSKKKSTKDLNKCLETNCSKEKKLYNKKLLAFAKSPNK